MLDPTRDAGVARVKPAPFDYHRPATLDEALELMADGEAKVLAGGQSLVPLMSMRLAAPSRIVDINRVAGLDGVETGGPDGLWVGAVARHRTVERSLHHQDLARQALACVAHPTIRNRGTVVGSLVHADPAAEMPAVLRLLGGSVAVVSQARGRRTIAADRLAVAPLESSLEPDEIAVSATLLRRPADSGAGWLEVSRRQGDYAIVGVGAVVTPGPDGRMAGAALVLIGVGSVPVYVDVTPGIAGADVAAFVDDRAGRELDAVAELVEGAIDPESDIHASSDYRRQLARHLSGRAIVTATRHAATRDAKR